MQLKDVPNHPETGEKPVSAEITVENEAIPIFGGPPIKPERDGEEVCSCCGSLIDSYTLTDEEYASAIRDYEAAKLRYQKTQGLEIIAGQITTTATAKYKTGEAEFVWTGSGWMATSWSICT